MTEDSVVSCVSLEGLPDITGLNAEHPGYVGTLDNCYAQCRELRKRQFSSAVGLVRVAVENSANNFRAIPGFRDIDLIDEPSSRINLEGYEISAEAIGYKLQYEKEEHTKDIERKIQDERRALNRRMSEISQSVEDNLLLIRRRMEDIQDALAQTTRYEVLSDQRSPEWNMHFYLVGPEEVHEVHIDLEGGVESSLKSVLELHKSPHLSPDNFDQDGFVERFRGGSKGINVNAYMVRNDSSVLSPSYLLMLGSREHVKYVEGIMASETERRDSLPPLERMLESLEKRVGRKGKQ